MPKPNDADCVRDARERLGLTQDQFAEVFDISKRSVRSYETGAADVPRTLLMAIKYQLKEQRK